MATYMLNHGAETTKDGAANVQFAAYGMNMYQQPAYTEDALRRLAAHNHHSQVSMERAWDFRDVSESGPRGWDMKWDTDADGNPTWPQDTLVGDGQWTNQYALLEWLSEEGGQVEVGDKLVFAVIPRATMVEYVMWETLAPKDGLEMALVRDNDDVEYLAGVTGDADSYGVHVFDIDEDGTGAMATAAGDYTRNVALAWRIDALPPGTTVDDECAGDPIPAGLKDWAIRTSAIVLNPWTGK